MSAAQWVLIVWIALSALFVVGRTGSTRRYTAVDAVAAVIECGVMIWLVTAL